MATKKLIQTGRVTALCSFVLGTAIFLFYYLTGDTGFVFLGYLFALGAGIFNLVLLVWLQVRAAGDPENRMAITKTCMFMALNLPAAALYFWLGALLLNTMRIHFTNASGHTLTAIEISGCETKHIDRLEAGDSKTVWISIPNDCSIHMTYLLGGELKKEEVAGYLTTGMGGKMQYNIGGENEPHF